MNPDQPQQMPQYPYGQGMPPNPPYPQGQPTPQPQNPAPPPNQPVGFDQYGNPLYAHPPEQQQQQPQFVHLARSIEPIEPNIPPHIMQRYEESKARYPHLNLSKGEYVIRAIKRHPIGILKIWGIAGVLILAFMALMIGFFMNGNSTLSAVADTSTFAMIGTGILIGLTILVVLGALIATYVYNNNRFYLTNESVVQEIQSSPFSKNEQTVSLANIEDASYKQGGILPILLNYGKIRLSTEGDETTYRFTYVADPKSHIAVLNNAVENFKNGRPVDVDPNDD
jgi:hypothetical protein